MNISSLVAFIEAVQNNSISKAAKNLHLTQSALSQQLKSLEKSLDADILIRSNRGVELTKEGEIVLEYAETLVNIYENMKKDIEMSKQSLIDEIKISSCNSVGEYLIPCTLHLYKKDRLKDKKNKLKFKLNNEHSKEIISKVVDCSIDVGFVDIETSNTEVECFKISSNNLTFIYSPKNDEINSHNLTLKDIAKLPLILGAKGRGLRDIIENVFFKKGINPENINVEFELDTIESVKASVIANHGVSIVPYTSVKKELHSNILKTISIEELQSSYSIFMIYLKNKGLKPYVKDFISYIKKYGRETFC